MKIFLKMKNIKNNKMITKGIKDFLKMKAKFGINMKNQYFKNALALYQLLFLLSINNF